MGKNETASKSIRWINYMRAISMIAIYLLHAEEFFGYTIKGLGKFIQPFYVHSFFFVSGYLLFKKQTAVTENQDRYAERKRFLLNLLFRMIIPSIIMSVLLFVPGSLLQERELTVYSFIEKTIMGYTFWFISALVVAELLVFLLLQSKIRNMCVYILYGVICFAAGCYIGTKGTYLPMFTSHPWQYEKGLMAVIFLVMGGVYQKYESKIDHILFKPITVIALLLLYIIPLVFISKEIKVLLSLNIMNAAGAVICMVSISLLLVACKFIKGSNSVTNHLDYIGRHTLGLYFVCGAIPKVLMILLPKVFPKGTLFYMLFGFILSFVLAEGVVYLLEKYAPFLFDLRNGFYHPNRKAHC